MNATRRIPALLLVSLLAPACATQISGSNDSDAATAADAAPVADAAPATDAATTDAAPDAAPDAGIHACMPDPADPSPHTLFVLPTKSSLVAVDSRGEDRTLYTFGAAEHLDASSVFITDVQSRGGFVAANAFLEIGSNNPEETVLFDPRGNLVWHRYVARDAHPQIWLNEQGWLTIDTYNGNGFAVAPDGTEHVLTGVAPSAAAAPWGEIPVHRGPSQEPTSLEWFDLATGSARPFAHPFDPYGFAAGGTPVWAGDRLLYPSGPNNSGLVVAEGASGVAVVASLPTSPGGTKPQLSTSDGERYALLAVGTADGTVGGLWRFDSRSGELATVNLTGPGGGQSATDRTNISAHVLADGSVLAGFDSGTDTTLFRTTDLGTSWQPVGDAVPHVMDSYARAMVPQFAGGTIAVWAHDNVNYMEAMSPVQLVPVGQRTAQSITVAFRQFQLVSHPATLSPSGQCLAYFTADPDVFSTTGTLHVTDLSGRTVDLFSVDGFGEGPLWMP